jgi:hypothetical protein
MAKLSVRCRRRKAGHFSKGRHSTRLDFRNFHPATTARMLINSCMRFSGLLSACGIRSDSGNKPPRGGFRVGSDRGWAAIQDSHTDKESMITRAVVDARCTEDGV